MTGFIQGGTDAPDIVDNTGCRIGLHHQYRLELVCGVGRQPGRDRVQIDGAAGPFGETRFAISEPAERSNSVTCMLMPRGESSRILDYCENNLGVTIGRGIGRLDERAIRIAHMGHVNAYNQLGTLAAIETAMAALGIEHGPGGVQSAIGYIANHVK